jgi:hypothetical protein
MLLRLVLLKLLTWLKPQEQIPGQHDTHMQLQRRACFYQRRGAQSKSVDLISNDGTCSAAYLQRYIPGLHTTRMPFVETCNS